MSITISELEYFLKVAETQNITKAAQELYIMQPSLSRSIASLEDSLGVKLFDRVGRNIVLNQYGRLVMPRAKRIMAELENMQSDIDESLEKREKTISIALSAASTFIPGLISEYKKKETGCSFEIDLSSVDEDDDVFMHNDLSVFTSSVLIDNDNTITLLKERLLLAIPADDPHAVQDFVSLSEFKDYGFVSLQTGHGLRTVTDQYCRMANFAPKIVLESDSPFTVREFIKAGLGIAFVPEYTWAEVRGNDISLKPIAYPDCVRYICLSWNPYGELPKQTARFRDYLIRNFRNYVFMNIGRGFRNGR